MDFLELLTPGSFFCSDLFHCGIQNFIHVSETCRTSGLRCFHGCPCLLQILVYISCSYYGAVASFFFIRHDDWYFYVNFRKILIFWDSFRLLKMLSTVLVMSNSLSYITSTYFALGNLYERYNSINCCITFK